MSSFAVYFSTLPVHLWGQGGVGQGGVEGGRDSPKAVSIPARRVERAWSQMSFVPGQPGQILFVQGCSRRVLMTTLPAPRPRRLGAASTSSTVIKSLDHQAGQKVELFHGSRVVALDGHQAQVHCLWGGTTGYDLSLPYTIHKVEQYISTPGSSSAPDADIARGCPR